MNELELAYCNVGEWTIASVVFRHENQRLVVPTKAVIGNSVPNTDTGKQKLREWKIAVASVAKEIRGFVPLNPTWHYCISAGFSFHRGNHGNQSLDVENFLKPSFDALAAGLFCECDQDPTQIPSYDYDDSNFRYLFVHRLADAVSENEEGVGFVVSIRK